MKRPDLSSCSFSYSYLNLTLLKISFLLLSQVSLACGDVVGVIEKHENGWWLVCIEDQQGWAPSSYLEPLVKATGEELNY